MSLDDCRGRPPLSHPKKRCLQTPGSQRALFGGFPWSTKVERVATVRPYIKKPGYARRSASTPTMGYSRSGSTFTRSRWQTTHLPMLRFMHVQWGHCTGKARHRESQRCVIKYAMTAFPDSTAA